MSGRERKYTVDTNIFIHATRNAEFREELIRFHATYAPFEVLSAVVAQELLAGVTGTAAKVIQHSVLGPFERRGRVIVPSYAAWKETGVVVSALIARGTARWPEVSRSFVNDILLAMSCREAGVVLVTENVKDFERIADVRPFAFTMPWPTPR